MNINNVVTVRLTQKGAHIYNEYFAELYARSTEPKLIDKVTDDTVSLQLWQLMRVFGAHISSQGEPLFMSDEIEI